MPKLFQLCSLLLIGTCASAHGETDTLRRVFNHLILGDTSSAVAEGKAYLEAHPGEIEAYFLYLRSLAELGDETEMLRIWEEFHVLFPSAALQTDILEAMAWGILKKGHKASGQSTRLVALIGAALTHDSRAIALLKEGLRDRNALIRTVAVELATFYRNEALKQEIRTLFFEERNGSVREKVLESIGALNVDELLPELLKILQNPQSGAEEKKLAAHAVSRLKNCIERDKIASFVSSRHSSLRMLACDCIPEYELKECADLLFSLLRDPAIQVRIQALYALGLFRKSISEEDFHFLLQSKDPELCIMLGWQILITQPEKKEVAEDILCRYLVHEKASLRCVAAGACAKTGKYGIPLCKKMLKESSDPYVRANLALALISQREACTEACLELNHFLRTNKEKWMKTRGLFPSLQKSSLPHHPAIINYPEAMNQTVRLEILNVLAMLETEGIQETLKEFFQERHWGVTGIAAELLLGEGDESAIEMVRALLSDADIKIRTEAALVLATWGRDQSAIPVLLEAYPKSDRSQKIKILESLGRVGDRQVIPFLIAQLKDPSQTLRLIASCILIQTLNH
jgi:HEAT repeat protein